MLSYDVDDSKVIEDVHVLSEIISGAAEDPLVNLVHRLLMRVKCFLWVPVML